MKRRRAAAALLAVLCAAAVAWAQDGADPAAGAKDDPKVKEKPPKASISTPMLRGRNGGPLIVDVTIEHEGRRVYRGPLEMTMTANGARVATVTAPEIAVAGSAVTQRYLLPAAMREFEEATVELTLVLRDADGAVDLGVHPLPAPKRSERSLTLAICDPWEAAGARHTGLFGSVMLDRFAPNRREPGVQTMLARVKPGDLPREPLAMCAYDVVLLPPAGLAELDEAQLRALAQWVRAGGAVCVVSGGNLAERHAVFLNGLIDGEAGVGYGVDDEGRLTLRRGQMPGGVGRLGGFDAGLGRVALALDPAGDEWLESLDWSAIVARLWRIRQSQLGRVTAGVGWERAQEQRSAWRDQTWDYAEYEVDTELRYGPLPLPSGSTLPALLTPTSVRVVPFGVVVAILVLFALAVGPGDWLLLGLLRQRKLTWLLFPATAVAFTLLTVVVADRMMGTEDHRRGVEILDVDRAGTVLRRTRLEMLFPGTQKTQTLELDGELVGRMDRLAFEAPQYDMHGNLLSGEVKQIDQPAALGGRYLRGYTLTQRLPKWTPWLNRWTELAPGDADPPFHVPWRELTDAVRAGRTAEGVESALEGAEFGGAVVLFGPGEEVSVLRGELDPTALGFASNVGDVGPLLRELCARPREGMFTVVAQLSPTGADNLEDVSVFDVTNPDQRLLVAVEGRGDDLRVYRHRFRMTPGAGELEAEGGGR